MNKKRIALVTFCLSLVTLVTSCGLLDSQIQPSTPISNQTIGDEVTGDKVVLSETVASGTFPGSVIPYGSEPAIQFSNLRLTKDGDFISGEVGFTRSNPGDFVLVAVVSLEEEMLYAYFDPDANLTIHLPTGTGSFGIDGYEIAGTDSGNIKFALTGRAFNRYSVFGEEATAFLFAVAGEVNPRSALPGDQSDPETFLANSNVLETELDLR